MEKEYNSDERVEELKKSPMFSFMLQYWFGSYWGKNGNARVYFGASALKKILQVAVETKENDLLVSVTYMDETLTPQEGAILLDTLNKVKLYYDLRIEQMVLDFRSLNHCYEQDLLDLKNLMQQYLDTHYLKGDDTREKV